jgi:hypothetical protein
MTEKQEEQTAHQIPNGTIKKIRRKIFIAEIFFAPNSKDTLQDTLLKGV